MIKSLHREVIYLAPFGICRFDAFKLIAAVVIRFDTFGLIAIIIGNHKDLYFQIWYTLL